MGAKWAWLGLFAVACSSSPSYGPGIEVVSAPTINPPPPRVPPPSCVTGALVDRDAVCGLGVAGRAYRWNDSRMRRLARRRAARNLAGMLRSVVNSALVFRQGEDGYWSREERYVEIDEALIDRIEGAATVELWFDRVGEGPFRAPERTYACACMPAVEAGIRIDPTQVARHGLSRQYAVDEVPPWLIHPEVQNDALQCAIGYHPRMYHPEEMLSPLTDSVRQQLVGRTRSWVLSEFDDRTVCAGSAPEDCALRLESLVEAANEGVSRGVALSAVWLDTLGLGPNAKKMSAYGWGCVYDAFVLEAARKRLEDLRLGSAVEGVASAPRVREIARTQTAYGRSTEAPTVWRVSSARWAADASASGHF